MDPAQLAQVESLCVALFQGTNANERSQAQEQLLSLQTSVEFIPQCQYILENSNQPYAQLVASQSLETLITQFWNNFANDQKLEIRNYIFNHLASRASNIEEFVVLRLTKLVCRITKLGWFDSPEHRQIIEEITKFLEATIDLHIIGLRILCTLVDEMNNQTTGKSLTTHRKTAVSFRDQALFQAFQLAISTLRNLQVGSMRGLTPQQQVKVGQLALELANACLGYDFIGTNPEESSEDVGTVQVPSAWRPIVQDTATLDLFFQFYIQCDPPRSSLALQALVQLSSVRRSLFATDKERAIFLQTLMSGIQSIMQSRKGLQHEENYHEFCRLLGRLKSSYQLSELVKISGFNEWLELSCDFTVKSLTNWQYSMNSIHYLLALWGRMVAALPYLRADVPSDSQRQANTLRQCVLLVAQSYIKTMLDSVEIVVEEEGAVDDPLADEGSLKEQMDRLPVIAHMQYETVADYILTLFQQTLTVYEQALTVNAVQPIAVLEGKAAWLTHMVAAVIGQQASPTEAKKPGEDLMWDSRLCQCVFRLMQTVDFRMNQSGGSSKCDVKLEIAILTFIKSFKKSFTSDGIMSSIPANVGFGSSVVGGSPAHPLLSMALSYTSEKESNTEVGTIYDMMGLGDSAQIMNSIVNKLCSNIKFWNRSDPILQETLEVFVELISNYSSSKTLLGLETVNFIVHNHTGAHFPFLGYDNDNKYRITFYSALSRLVFSSSEDLNNAFDVFMAPNLAIMRQLQQTANLRLPDVRTAIIAALRDLRGITASTYNKRTYNLLFDALYPDSFKLMNRVAETWFDDPNVMTALLKFLQEFVHNKAQRICFEQSSANGILLFRETSNILCIYGSQVLHLPVISDVYLEKYKGIRLLLNTLTAALSGNYVNFGVFALYDDKALQNALDVALQMCLQIPIADVMTYPKLSRAYFSNLEILFRNHLDVLCGLGSPVFMRLLLTNIEGINSNDMSVCALCSNTVDHFATFIFLNRNKDKPSMQMIRNHIESDPTSLHQLMSTLFNALLFNSQANQWALTRPILSLLLADETTYAAFQTQLISSQNPENQAKLVEEFAKLLVDVQQSVESTNRDKFTQKLTVFRLNVRQFLTI